MSKDSKRSLPGQMVLGIAVIAMGVLFMLDNLDIFNFRHVLHFWPMAFILFGALKMYDSNTAGGRATGAALVVVGVLMTLSHMGLIYFSWRMGWPLVLIVVGFAVVARAMESRKLQEEGAAGGDKQSDSVINATAILGGIERRVVTQDFRGGEATAIMGGCELDLRESSINGEAVLNVFALMGGIALKVPADWTVVVSGTPILGGFDERTAKAPDTNKRLVIKGFAILGGVEVRN